MAGSKAVVFAKANDAQTPKEVAEQHTERRVSNNEAQGFKVPHQPASKTKVKTRDQTAVSSNGDLGGASYPQNDAQAAVRDQGDIFDQTDVESIDGTTTTTSMSDARPRVVSPSSLLTDLDAYREQYPDNDDDDYNEYEVEDEHLNDIVGAIQSGQQEHLPAAHHHLSKVNPQKAPSSYPTTTSGTSGRSLSNEKQDLNLPVQRDISHESAPAATRQPIPATQNVVAGAHVPHMPVRQPAIASSHPSGHSQFPARQALQARGETRRVNQQAPGFVTNAAQAQGDVFAPQTRIKGTTSSQNALQSTGGRFDPVQPHRLPNHEQPQTPPTSAQVDEAENGRFQYERSPSVHSSAGDAEVSDPDDPKADYSASELANMSFKDLQHEPYDFCPGSVREGHTPQTLHALLATGYPVPSEQRPNLRKEQIAVLTSLTLSEWDEAGNWFVEQFMDLTKQLITARRGKRDLALRFEAEVEKRNDAVSRKRKATEDAFDVIKNIGSRVIAVTPAGKKRG